MIGLVVMGMIYWTNSDDHGKKIDIVLKISGVKLALLYSQEIRSVYLQEQQAWLV